MACGVVRPAFFVGTDLAGRGRAGVCIWLIGACVLRIDPDIMPRLAVGVEGPEGFRVVPDK